MTTAPAPAARLLAHDACQRIISMIFESALKPGDLLQEAAWGSFSARPAPPCARRSRGWKANGGPWSRAVSPALAA